MMPFPPVADDRVHELGDFPEMDTGAPLPELRIDQDRTVLSYYGSGRVRGAVAFKMVRAQYFGYPNDEALNAHRLYAKGLRFYSAYEVTGSSWIQSIMVADRVHPSHRDSHYDACRHFVVTFHDETFECIANGYEVVSTG